MISLRYVDVPAFLHSGAFFRSLNHEDPLLEIEIPVDCCFLGDTIGSSGDLEIFLKSLKFWGVDEAPRELVTYISHQQHKYFDYWSIMQKYENDLPFLWQFRDFSTMAPRDRILRAIKRKELSELTMHIRMTYKFATECFMIDECLKNNFVVGLRLLCQLIKPGVYMPWSAKSMYLPIEKGYMEAVKIILEETAAFKEPKGLSLRDLQQFAVATKQLSMLKYLVQRNDNVLFPEALSLAVNVASMEMVQYCLAQGQTWGRAAMQKCLEVNDLSFLTMALAADCPLPPTALERAFDCSAPKLVRYLLESGRGDCGSKSISIYDYLHSPDRRECVLLALDHGCPLNCNLLSELRNHLLTKQAMVSYNTDIGSDVVMRHRCLQLLDLHPLTKVRGRKWMLKMFNKWKEKDELDDARRQYGIGVWAYQPSDWIKFFCEQAFKKDDPELICAVHAASARTISAHRISVTAYNNYLTTTGATTTTSSSFSSSSSSGEPRPCQKGCGGWGTFTVTEALWAKSAKCGQMALQLGAPSSSLSSLLLGSTLSPLSLPAPAGAVVAKGAGAESKATSSFSSTV